MTRPDSIHEISCRVAAGEQNFDMSVREFLDSFYMDPAGRQHALEAPPLKLTALRDAYLAATAEHLAETYGLATPAWTDTHGFEMEKPFFAGGLETLKALLLVESPTAFRRRLVFVSRNALFRPHA